MFEALHVKNSKFIHVFKMEYLFKNHFEELHLLKIPGFSIF